MLNATRAQRQRSVWPLLLCTLIIHTCILQLPSAPAQELLDSDQLFSPSAGQIFYEVAYELANSDQLSAPQAEQAAVFLTATIYLDSRANYVLPDMIKLAAQQPQQNRFQFVHDLLTNYVDQSADLEIVTQAVQYLLEQLNSREEREKFLEDFTQRIGGKNPVLDSEFACLLGLLMVEKADFDAAQFYFMQAFNNNKYNRLAFEKLLELAPQQIEPAMYLEHLRLTLAENPFDIEAALGFAQYAERLQLYDTAADTYEYCVNLFEYLYPSQQLPANIYLPWAISSYNTRRNQYRALQIAEKIRQSGRLDLILEAIAAKAAQKIGNTQQAEQILQDAEKKIQEMLISNQSARQNLPPELLGWFYCFAMTDPGKAIDWANKAYSTQPDSPTTAAILAYALAINAQNDWAKTIIDSYENNQIAELTLAKIQLAQGQTDAAIETLKSAIAKDPAALEAEQAKKILAEHGGEYVPPIDPDLTLAVLRNNFGPTAVPTFEAPQKMISVQLNLRGSKFPYASKFGGSVAITNNSSEPLVISDHGLFTGNIRIDANVTGDINKKIPNLVSLRTRPTSPVGPGQSIFIPVRLVTGQLRKLLSTYPQAFLDIEFTVYIDPVTNDHGVTNRLPGIEPAKIVASRPGTELTGRFLRNRFNSLSNGRQGQKIRTAQLFTGLLAEQQAMAQREPLYKFMYADWMPELLKSALVHNLAGDDWVAKVHTMTAMLSLPLDYQLINALAENLNDSHWPTRLMALYLLAKKQDASFKKVLDWTAEYDSNLLVRDMAIALGAARRKKTDELSTEGQPTEQPGTGD
jgi:tetratricopeptide (TPR) repeat protein